jgi:hypothetical protein
MLRRLKRTAHTAVVLKGPNSSIPIYEMGLYIFFETCIDFDSKKIFSEMGLELFNHNGMYNPQMLLYTFDRYTIHFVSFLSMMVDC